METIIEEESLREPESEIEELESFQTPEIFMEEPKELEELEELEEEEEPDNIILLEEMQEKEEPDNIILLEEVQEQIEKDILLGEEFEIESILEKVQEQIEKDILLGELQEQLEQNLLSEKEKEEEEQQLENDILLSKDYFANVTSNTLFFIVPYRDRERQLGFFLRQMDYVLKNVDHRFIIVHQNDNRPFNRGALKNIGFLFLKEKFPDLYKQFTLVFNDVDCMPFDPNFFNYNTSPGTVKHFYGFTYTLGGIVSFNAGDFERIGGFPNFWSWGFEDNYLLKRSIQHNLFIDRSHFLPLFDKDIIHLQHGFYRSIPNEKLNDKNIKLDSLSDISLKTYYFDSPFLNVSHFDTRFIPDFSLKEHDLRNGNPSIQNSNTSKKKIMNMTLF